MNEPRKPFDPMWKLNKLHIDEAKRLLIALAIEEDGLEGDPHGTHLYCCAKDHPRQSGTPSIVLYKKTRKEGNAWVEVGDEVGRVKCYGGCGFGGKGQSGQLSDYLKKMGPETEQFWTNERVEKIIADLKHHDKPFVLGWKAWKESQGIKCNGKDSNVGHEKTNTASKQSNDRLRSMYRLLFKESLKDPKHSSLIQKVCLKRKWSQEILLQCIKEGIVSVGPAEGLPDDVQIGFAYRGFFSTPVGFPVRFVKTRLLNRNQKDDKNSRLTYTDPGCESTQIGDFSAANVDFQTADRIVFLEGEPDAISWRHVFPNDAVICIGNVNEYKKMPEILSMLNLKGREVVYVIDRDYDKNTGVPKYDLDKHQPLLMAILKEEPKSLKTWMCPHIEGKDSKDVNDFLKHFGPRETILNACIEVPQEKLEMPNEVFKQILVKSFSRKAVS